MRFHSRPIDEHVEVPLADEGRLEEIIAHWTGREAPQRAAAPGGNACYVVSVQRCDDGYTSELEAAAQLEEICALVLTQGDRVAGRQGHRLIKPDPRTLIRRGVAARIGDEARACGADLLVVDAELSPSQTRNLEDATGLPVSDREAVILNVFERNATTRRARIQVELAHLEYLRPRIRGIGLNMDQQAGGIIGGRGPGETASELFARRLDGRLADLRRRLEQLKHSDAAQRKHRAGAARVVLVGYTNAGKTSLMNALTSAALSARNRLFETLDTTSRCLTRHGGVVLLSDTVGFIRKLPDRLLASFESTLAEVSEASLLLVVVDVSDPEAEQHLATTLSMLQRLGADGIPRRIIFNKLDRLPTAADPARLAALSAGHPYVALSSRDPAAVAALRETLLAEVRARHRVREVFVPYAQHAVSAAIYARCRVLKAIGTERGTQFQIEAEPHVVDDIARSLRSKRK
jgi:GTP-binding protein HflX